MDDRLQQVLDQVLNRTVILLTIFAIPTALSSVVRAVSHGWQPVFGLQLGIVTVLLIATWWRHQITSTTKAALLISSCVFVAWAGLYTFGVMASAGHWLAVLAIFLIGMVCNTKSAIIGTGIVLAGIAAIGLFEVSGYIEPAITPAVFVSAAGSWVVELLCSLLFIATVFPTVSDYKAATREMIAASETRRNKIAYLAEHDQLTDLPLLRTARDRLDMACSRARRNKAKAALFFIDLDGFKTLNDTHGHDAGDACLKAIATRLNTRLRAEDTASRIGGDEFVVVLDEISGSFEATQLAAELIELINVPTSFSNAELQVGASIGIAMFPDNSLNAQRLQPLADKAMYEAKQAGKNRYVLSTATPATDGAAEKTERLATNTGTENDLRSQPPKDRITLLESIVDRTAIVFCLLCYPAALANFWRISANNAAPNFFYLITALVLITGLALGRRHIPMPVKSTLICTIGLIIAIPGLLKSGLAAPLPGWAFAISLYLSAIFFNDWIGRCVAAIVSLSIVVAGIGFTTGSLQYAYDVNQQAIHPGTWLVFLLVAVAVSGLFLSVWSLYKKNAVVLIEEGNQQAKDLRRLADYDQLTGLPLQRLASKRFNLTCRRTARARNRAAVFFIDIDGFKAVNDNYGHDAGNHCLSELAQRMTTCTREVDTVARIGGDEFLVVIDSVTDHHDLKVVALKLIDIIAQPMTFNQATFSVSASLGIAVFPDHGQTFEELRKLADEAMYSAKKQGKNRFVIATQKKGTHEQAVPEDLASLSPLPPVSL
ncbi:MAG: diguanylate cyclase [Oceanicoccus sp.]